MEFWMGEAIYLWIMTGRALNGNLGEEVMNEGGRSIHRR